MSLMLLEIKFDKLHVDFFSVQGASLNAHMAVSLRTQYLEVGSFHNRFSPHPSHLTPAHVSAGGWGMENKSDHKQANNV